MQESRQAAPDRSGMGIRLSSGNDDHVLLRKRADQHQANFNGKEPFGGVPVGPFKGKTVPVGSYAPNAWGLYDMYGNVAEWCSDWYDAAYYGNSARANPIGPKDGKLKVVRGGAWNLSGAALRSARRAGYNPTLRLNTIGFRCVKDDADSVKTRQKTH